MGFKIAIQTKKWNKWLLKSLFIVSISLAMLTFTINPTSSSHYMGVYDFDLDWRIQAAIKEPPVASFKSFPESPSAGESMTFDASSSYDPDGIIESYYWNFGDGSSEYLFRVVNHIYKEAGTYMVSLTIVDKDNLSDTFTAEVKVLPPPIHDVAVSTVSTNTTSVVSGKAVKITVVVENQGDSKETFNVVVFYDNMFIQTRVVTDLEAYSNETLEFTWNTIGVPNNTYIIKATAFLLSEPDISDNEHINGKVSVTRPKNVDSCSVSMDYIFALTGVLILSIIVIYFVAKRA